MADRPLDGATPRYPNFATADSTDPVSGEANVQTPSPEVQASGWRRLERPPRYWLNWLHRLYNQWIQWFDQEIESFRTVLNVTIPGQISALDGRLDTIEGQNLNTRMGTVETAVSSLDGRLDTLEGQTLDSRLDTIEALIDDYPIPFNTYSGTIEFAGLGSANVSADYFAVLHNPFSVTGTPQKVSLWIEGVNGAANGSFAQFQTGTAALPSQITPASGGSIAVPVVVINNSTNVPGILRINDAGRVTIECLSSGAFTSAFAFTGNKGFLADVIVEYVV